MAALRVASSLVLVSSTSRDVFPVSETGVARCFGSANCRWNELTRRRRGNKSGSIVSSYHGFRDVLHRPVAVRAASEQLTAEESVEKGSKRESLKQKLVQQIVEASGNLTEYCIATIKELEKFNPNPESLNDPELYAGYWERLRAGHMGTGRKGEAKVEVGYEGASATLGRATFNTFKPADLEIVMGEVFNYVPKVDVEGEGKYAIYIEFTTKNPKGTDLPPIEGLIINAATPQIENPSKMGLLFDETILRPKNPERDLEAWKEIFEEASGGRMNAIGEVSVKNKTPPAGFLDVTYIDDELRITKGNLGSYVVVRRMDKPPEFIK